MTVFKEILDTIGNTPLVELCAIKEKYKLNANIFAKMESFNPGGSVKDRTAYSLIRGLQKDGEYIDAVKNNRKISIVEATSGNTGIALAMIQKWVTTSLSVCQTMPVCRGCSRKADGERGCRRCRLWHERCDR